MYRAVILRNDYSEGPAPSAKEMQDYVKKSTRLLYADDKRKSKSTPMRDKIHLVDYALSTFRNLLDGERFESTALYVFDERVNSTHFLMKYSAIHVCSFKLDEQILDHMWNVAWNYGHLCRFKKSCEGDIGQTEFFAEKNVGSKRFHAKAVPPFIKRTKEFIGEIDKEIAALEDEAISLFKSGWD